MSYGKYKVAVAGLITKGEKVLLHHRTDYDAWDLPSGGMEAGETIIQTLKREVREETGLKVEPKKLIGVYHNFKRDVIVFIFLVKVISGKLTKNKEADDFGYFLYKKLPRNIIPKHRERILNYFNNRKKVAIVTQRSWPSIKTLKKINKINK